MIKRKTLYKDSVAVNAVLFLLQISENRQCNIDEIFKMIYFADQLSMIGATRSITYDTYIPTLKGPMPTNLAKSIRTSRDKFKLQKNGMLKSLVLSDNNYLSLSDIGYLEEVYHKCKKISSSQLVFMSCGYAWEKARANKTLMTTRDIMEETGCDKYLIDFVIEEDEIQLALL